MKIRKIYAAGAAIALAFGLAACGDSEEETPAVIEEETPADVAEETTDEEAEDSAESDEAEDSAESDEAEDEKAQAEAELAELIEQEGMLVDEDLEANVLDGVGLAITVDKEAQTVHFATLDPATGESYTNTFTFDFANSQYLHHKYVSAMGAEFNYTMDLESNEILEILDAEGVDGIEAVKEQGRFEIAQADRDSEREELEAYFEARYGMSVEEAATN